MTVLKKPRARVHNRDRHAEILDAAREVFLQSGFEAATTAAIAKSANVAEGTLYRYATTKRDLLEQVIGEWYNALEAELKAGLDRHATTREKLRFAAHHQFKVFSDHGAIAQLMVREMRAKVVGQRSRIDQMNRSYTRLLVEALAEGQKNGEIRPDLPLPLARDMFFGTIEHSAMTTTTAQESQSRIEAFVDKYWELVSN